MRKRRKLIPFCMSCARKLRSKISMKRGYGPTCYAKRPSLGYQELEAAGQLSLFSKVSA